MGIHDLKAFIKCYQLLFIAHIVNWKIVQGMVCILSSIYPRPDNGRSLQCVAGFCFYLVKQGYQIVLQQSELGCFTGLQKSTERKNGNYWF